MVSAKQWLTSLSLVTLLGSGNLLQPGTLAQIGSETKPGPVTLHATIEAIGIVAPYSGDDNQTNTASVWYRPVGDPVLLPGPEMYADRDAREWRVSLVHCAPATEYEVEIRYADPDGVQPSVVHASVRTRPDYPDTGRGGRVWYVPDDGSLQGVIDSVSAGDTIRIRGGNYYVSAEIGPEDSGAPGSYITIEADPGARVVLDGSDPDLNDVSADNWLPGQGDIYYTDLAWTDNGCSMPNYVGEQRAGDSWRYPLYKGDGEWDEFLAAPPGKAYYDCESRLFVATYDGDDPDNHKMHVSRRATALALEGASYVRVRNLEVRHYGAYGVRLTETSGSHNVIEGNTFHGIGGSHVIVGSYGGSYSSHNLIQENRFYEQGYRNSGWTWHAAHDHATSAGVLLVGAGPGNVVRNNTVIGGLDGIDVRQQSHHTDVYENTIRECMDDGIEIDDEPGHNIRVWGNSIQYCYSSVSNQGWFKGDHWNSGPVYVFRNVIEGGADLQSRKPLDSSDPYEEGYYTHYAFKVGTDENHLGRVYYYHNTIVIRDPDQKGNGIQDAGGPYWSGLVARNNIWAVSRQVYNLRHASTQHQVDCNNLYSSSDRHFVVWAGEEYDGLTEFQAQTDQELHSISNRGTLFDSDWSLQAGSPEIDAGCVIVGFNDRGPWAYRGPKPDIGAFELSGDPDLSTSTKTASPAAVSTSELLTYKVRIVNTGGPLTSTAVMTDVLPIGIDYLTGTVTADLGTAWATRDAARTSIHWQGVLNDTPLAEIRYQVRVEVSDTVAISNIAWIDDRLTQVIKRSATIIVNGRRAYLPLILRDL